MNINFPPVDEKYLRDKVQEGYYSNVTEAVRDAVRKMREKDPETGGGEERLRALLQVGLHQIERGKTVEYTPEFMKDVMRRAIENAGSGRPFKDEVIPPSWRK